MEEEKILEKIKKYAEENNFNLGKEKIVNFVIKGLVKNKKKYGEYYCPCRVVSGNKKEDEKKICPCFWHKEEIAKYGKCLCGLFRR